MAPNEPPMSDDPADRLLRTGEQSTFTEPSTTSPHTERPETCEKEEPEGGMTYDQMIDQQICARDQFLWPPENYPIIEPSSNLRFVGGGFEEFYGYQPMRIAYECAWIEWWYTAWTVGDQELTRSIETWLEDDGLAHLEEVTSYNPDRAANTIEGINRFLDAARLEDINAVNEIRQGTCSAWTWTTAPSFTIPPDFQDDSAVFAYREFAV